MYMQWLSSMIFHFQIKTCYFSVILTFLTVSHNFYQLVKPPLQVSHHFSLKNIQDHAKQFCKLQWLLQKMFHVTMTTYIFLPANQRLILELLMYLSPRFIVFFFNFYAIKHLVFFFVIQAFVFYDITQSSLFWYHLSFDILFLLISSDL